MAGRNKRKKQTPGPRARTKKPGTFNPVIEESAAFTKKDLSLPWDPKEKTPKEPCQTEGEDLYFLEAMSDVSPLSKTKNKIIHQPDPNLKPGHPAENDEQEALAHLSDLVSGNAEIDITFTDEYIEGAVSGFSRKLMRRLKKGQFPIQDHVDLHGLTKQEAEIRVRDFLLQSSRRGLRCVLIVHGRGLNSENHIPVLKERLPVWLNRGPVRKIVLAFSTARPYDGGAGAVYVLLRR